MKEDFNVRSKTNIKSLYQISFITNNEFNYRISKKEILSHYYFDFISRYTILSTVMNECIILIFKMDNIIRICVGRLENFIKVLIY